MDYIAERHGVWQNVPLTKKSEDLSRLGELCAFMEWGQAPC
jgi:hypothetical protein